MSPPREESPLPLTTSQIGRFFLPLALSWLFMSAETPISIRAMSGLPDPGLHIAAFFIFMAVSMWIESPVIDLLATATTLVRGKCSLRQVRRFATLTMVWVTVIHAAVALTPLYGLLLRGAFRLPADVVEAAHVPLMVMTPWSALIGWRRFQQGVMIAAGATRRVGIGTAIRVATIAGVGLGVAAWGGLPGATTAAVALLASVAAEAGYITWAARPALARAKAWPEDRPAPTLRQLTAFHLPLTATTMLALSAPPLVGAALAQSRDHVLAIAAWQVALSLASLLRTPSYALPEVVIALGRIPGSERALKRFCHAVGIGLSLVLVFFAATRLDQAFFVWVLGAEPQVAAAAHLGVWLCAPLPWLVAAQSHLRGLLTSAHQTRARLWSAVAGLVGLGVGLAVGIGAGWPGVAAAATALIVSMASEWIALASAWRRVPVHSG